MLSRRVALRDVYWDRLVSSVWYYWSSVFFRYWWKRLVCKRRCYCLWRIFFRIVCNKLLLMDVFLVMLKLKRVCHRGRLLLLYFFPVTCCLYFVFVRPSVNTCFLIFWPRFNVDSAMQNWNWTRIRMSIWFFGNVKMLNLVFYVCRSMVTTLNS